MIKSFSITNHLGETIKLELGFPEKSGFLILDVDGLGPAKADINTVELLNDDGSIYNSARVNSRNIVFRLQFLESPTIEDIRQKTYKYFPIKKRVDILVETDNRISQTYGYVESNEIDLFSKKEGAVISVLCPSAYFYSTSYTSTIFSGLESYFEFPFENQSLTIPLLQFGVIHNDNQRSIYYNGDADTGIVMYLHATGVVEDLQIYNAMTRELMDINTDRIAEMTGDGIIAGDDIIIVTLRNSKSITLIRDGVATNILNALNRDADWFRLVKGDNVFAFLASVGVSEMQMRIENQTIYEGV